MEIANLIKLNQLKSKFINIKMSIKTTYKFTRLFKEIEEQVDFFNTTLSDLIKEYGQKDENGKYILTDDQNGIKIREDKYEECMSKINELNNLDINLDYIPNFTLDELDNLELSIDEMTLLIPFIAEN